MIHLPASVRVYLCLSPCDMRRSFDGLHTLVRDHLQLDPFAGHLYLFANKRRDRLKLLYWDRAMALRSGRSGWKRAVT
jgi:transposase